MATVFEQSVAQCLRSANPLLELRAFVERQMQQGAEPSAVLSLLENLRQQLRQTGREVDEDTITDVMDFLVGWCSPHMKLATHPPEPSGPP